MKLKLGELKKYIETQIRQSRLGYFGTFLNKTQYYITQAHERNIHLYIHFKNPLNGKKLTAQVIDTDNYIYYIVKLTHSELGDLRIDSRSLNDKKLAYFLVYSGNVKYIHKE